MQELRSALGKALQSLVRTGNLTRLQFLTCFTIGRPPNQPPVFFTSVLSQKMSQGSLSAWQTAGVLSPRDCIPRRWPQPRELAWGRYGLDMVSTPLGKLTASWPSRHISFLSNSHCQPFNHADLCSITYCCKVQFFDSLLLKIPTES